MNHELHIATLANAPSPLVGEGSSAVQHKLAGVRGSLRGRAVRIDPLTRRRFATPPSPTRGEGKSSASQAIQ